MFKYTDIAKQVWALNFIHIAEVLVKSRNKIDKI